MARVLACGLSDLVGYSGVRIAREPVLKRSEMVVDQRLHLVAQYGDRGGE
jgi:hypothetical protein